MLDLNTLSSALGEMRSGSRASEVATSLGVKEKDLLAALKSRGLDPVHVSDTSVDIDRAKAIFHSTKSLLATARKLDVSYSALRTLFVAEGIPLSPDKVRLAASRRRAPEEAWVRTDPSPQRSLRDSDAGSSSTSNPARESRSSGAETAPGTFEASFEGLTKKERNRLILKLLETKEVKEVAALSGLTTAAIYYIRKKAPG